MAKNQNTFEKRRREMDKKFKAEQKRKRRKEKKERGDEDAPARPMTAADYLGETEDDQ